MKHDDTSPNMEDWSREKLFDEVKHSINGNNKRGALIFLEALRDRCFAKDAEVSVLIEKLQDVQSRD